MEEAPAMAQLTGNDKIGQDIYALAAEIFPICRSITGDGVRKTIEMLGRYFPIRAP